MRLGPLLTRGRVGDVIAISLKPLNCLESVCSLLPESYGPLDQTNCELAVTIFRF